MEVVVDIINLRVISAIPIMCQIIQTIGTLTKFKIIHSFPVRLQKKALNSQQFIILIAANQTSVAMHTITASMNCNRPTLKYMLTAKCENIFSITFTISTTELSTECCSNNWVSHVSKSGKNRRAQCHFIYGFVPCGCCHVDTGRRIHWISRRYKNHFLLTYITVNYTLLFVFSLQKRCTYVFKSWKLKICLYTSYSNFPQYSRLKQYRHHSVESEKTG
jgi:hypothetical protein